MILKTAGLTCLSSLTFTNKAHIIISHVPQVIAGLFYQSEEVVDVESELHGKNLLECLLDFNTKNI